MLKRFLSLIIAGAIMVSSVSSVFAVTYGEEYQNQPTKTYSQVFSDVSKGHWAFSYIGEMNQRGVISGYPNGCYYPENYVTRAEFAKIMCVAAGLSINEVSSTSYYDVEPNEWYAPYIEIGRYYLSGYTSNGASYYHPDDNALREDIAVALVKLKGYSTTGADESMLRTIFKDYQSISTDARKYVAAALENGLISGYEDNTFRGQDSITRAEAATLLWRAYQYGNGNKTFDDGKEVTQAPVKEIVQDESETVDVTVMEQAPQNSGTEKENIAPKKATYACETLVSAKMFNSFKNSTIDKKDNLYYFDESDNVVYKLSLSNSKRTKVFDINDFVYKDIEIMTKEITKEVPKIITKTVEKEVPIEESEEIESQVENEVADDNNDIESNDGGENLISTEAEKPDISDGKKTKTVTEEITETIYKTVTETVEEKNIKGTYKDFDFNQIYYNTGDDTLYFTGKFNFYETENSLQDERAWFKPLFKINGGKAEFVCEFEYDKIPISGNFSDGRLIVPSGSYDCWSSQVYYILDLKDMSKQTMKADFTYDPNSAINLLSFVSENTVYSANVNKTSTTFSKYSFSNNSWGTLTNASSSFTGIKDDSVYYWDLNKGQIAKSDITGKIAYIENLDTKNDIDVLDFKNIPASSYNRTAQKLYITDKQEFVFYDTDNYCWRIIKKQK